jgi:glycosyltransferase involved in cell wall biosynthesis
MSLKSPNPQPLPSREGEQIHSPFPSGKGARGLGGLVSIVTASKNYARFLPFAVDSVLAQTFTDWELIVIDDGSTDNTSEVIAPYLVDPRIRCVKSDRLGQSRAKNLGIALSRGEFVAFLDADDIWDATKLEKQLPLFRGEVGVVFSRRHLIDESGNRLPPRNDPPPPRGRVLNEIFVQNFVCFSSCVVRRELFDRVGRFDESLDLAIDYDLWLRAAPHVSFDYVDEPLVHYRTGHGNLSQRVRDRVLTACSIMARAVARGGLSPETVAEGYASTCRTLGYVLRRTEPRESFRWYAKALRWPHGRIASLKGLAAAVIYSVIP